MSTNLLLTIIGGFFIIIMIKCMIEFKEDKQEEAPRKQNLYALKSKQLEKKAPNLKVRKQVQEAPKAIKNQTGKIIDLQARRKEKNMMLEKKAQRCSKMRL